MLQTLHPATRFPGSALAFAHNSVLSSCTTYKDVGWSRPCGSWESNWLLRKKKERKKESSDLLLSLYHFGTNTVLKWFTGADGGWQDGCLFGSCSKIPLSENWQLTLNTVLYCLFTVWHSNVLSSPQPWNRWNQQFRERSALFQQKKCSLRGMISRSHLGGIDAVALTHRSSRLTYWPTVMLTSLAPVFTKVISCKGWGDLSHGNRQHLLAH